MKFSKQLPRYIFVYICAIIFGSSFVWKEFDWITLDDTKIEKLDSQATTDASRFLFGKAISEFEQLNVLYSLKGKANLAARMRIKIGFQYDKDGDYLTGIPIIKKVAYDETLSPEIRSEAMARIIMAYSGNEKREIMQSIFNDTNPIMRGSLGGGNINSLQDLRKAAVALLERANGIYEYSYLDYLLAARKSYLLTSEINYFNGEEIAAKKAEVLSLIQSGDALLKTEISRNDFKRGGFNYDFLTSGQSQKLQAFAQLALIDRVYEKSATDVFDGLATIRDTYYKNGSDNPTYFGTEFFIRFYYASMLAHFYGSADKKELEDIMAPTMIETGNRGIANRKIAWRFYQNALTRPEKDRSSNYRSIIQLASILPDFNQFLLQQGWSNS